MFFVTCVLLCKRKVCTIFLNNNFKDEFDFFYKLNEHGLVRECIKRRKKKLVWASKIGIDLGV